MGKRRDRETAILVFLFRKVAIYAVIFDAVGQALTMLLQLLFVEINSSLFLFWPCCGIVMAWWRLRDGKRESATTRHIDECQGQNLQSAFSAIGTAVEEVTETESLFAALQDERAILRRDQFRARVERHLHHALMKVRPGKGSPELARHRALGVIAVAAQVAKVDAPTQSEDRRKQNFKELALQLTHRSHLLQDVIDNCHRPFTS